MNTKEDTTLLLGDYRRHAAPSVLRELQWVVSEATGAELRTAEGRHLIDFASGGFGFGDPRVRDAVTAQVKKAPLSSRLLINRGLTALVLKLADIAPAPLAVSYVCNSGEEALDSALKLAKGRWPRRRKVVTVAGGHYGTLSHGLQLAGIGSPLLAHLPFTPRRIGFGDTDEARQAIDKDTAAVLLEPLALSGGDMTAPPAFWRLLRERCDATGALLIVSELRTGLGRAGTRWAVDTTGIVPDVLVVGGALDGGHVPVGAYITRKALNDAVYGRRNPSLHGSTTGGNPVCCAAALAALAVIEEEGLARRHDAFGRNAALALDALAQQPATGVVRVQQVGSLIAVDCATVARAQQLHRAAVQAGVWMRPPVGPRLLLNPPLIASPQALQEGAQRLLSAWVKHLSFTAGACVAMAQDEKVTV